MVVIANHDFDDCDDDNLECFLFSWFSSCGRLLDRGMGNQLLARQVAIRSLYFESREAAPSCTFVAVLAICKKARKTTEG